MDGSRLSGSRIDLCPVADDEGQRDRPGFKYGYASSWSETVVNKNLIYVGIAGVVIFYLWRKKLGGVSPGTIIEGGIPLEEQVVPGPPESQANPWDNHDQDYNVAIGPLVVWLQNLQEAHDHLLRDMRPQVQFPSRVRNNVVARLAGWRRWINNLFAANLQSILIVSDFAAIANAWTAHMFWFENINGHGVNYEPHEERAAQQICDNARRYVSPVVAQYNGLDENLLAWYEQYGRYFQEMYGNLRPISHLEDV